MKTIVTALFLGLTLTASYASQNDVIVSFQKYRMAILKQKGKTASGLVTQNTLNQYHNYVNWALTADRGTLESLPFIDRLQVFLFKHRVPKKELKKLSGRTAFEYVVDNDWIGKNQLIATKLGEVTLLDQQANVTAVIGGKKAPSPFKFLKETQGDKETWKFDLISVIRDSNLLLKAAALESGMSEEAFLFSLVEAASGKKVEKSIWHPIVKRR